MRFVRYINKSGIPEVGWLHQERVGRVDGLPYGEYHREEATTPLSEVRLLAPVMPSKIICVGRNYAAHAKEQKAEVPEVPILFLKPTSSVIGPGDTILLPPQSKQVEHEAELVVVIGTKGRWISPERADQYILGYTIGNDVTARDLQRRDGQWTRGKGFDTFCPLGPWVETEFDPADALITCYVNGEMRQMASTRDMIFRVKQLVAFASSVMTLNPGDILMTGTPAGVSPLMPGDTVDVTIEGLGKLTNPVAAEPVRT